MAPGICPPCLVSRGATEEADIYAFAVTTYEILMPGISYPWCKELSSAALRDPTTIYLAVKDGKRPSLEDLAGFYSRKDHPILNDLARLIEICWKQDPLDRPTASRVLCTVEELMPSKSVTQSPRLSPAKRPFPVSEEKHVTKRLFQDTSLRHKFKSFNIKTRDWVAKKY